jgi:hypothetical protein
VAHRCSIIAELRPRPQLTLIFPKILNDKRADTRNGQQTLAARVDSEPAEIASNPSSTKRFRNDSGCSAANETIENNIALIR